MTTLDHGPVASRPVVRVPLGILVAAVVASVANIVVAAIAHAAGASEAFKPLDIGAFVFFTVIGVLLGTAGWAVVRRTRRAASTLRWLVPTVLVVSLVPDLLVGLGDSMAGATWTGVIGLMVMHVVVAAVLVTVLTRVLPVADRVTPGGASR